MRLSRRAGSCSSRGSATSWRSRPWPGVLVEISMLKVFRSSRSGARRRSETYWTASGPEGLGVRLAGLCDAAEERHFQRALERAGFGSNLGRADLEALGFYVCDVDLEDELVRSLGAAVVERVIEAEGEWASFQTFQKQPEKRRLTRDAQLHGFMWNRKIRYARLLVDALDLAQVPRPFDRVLAHV